MRDTYLHACVCEFVTEAHLRFLLALRGAGEDVGDGLLFSFKIL